MLRALRFAAGAVVGLVLWWYATPQYDAVLASVVQRMIAIDGRLCRPAVVARRRIIDVRPRRCNSPTARIPADQLTYNIILLTALFATRRHPLRDNNVLTFAISLLVIALTHVLSLAVSIESTYAAQLGSWSEQNYGAAEQSLWVTAEFMWRLAGMFAIVFACWWIAGSQRE